MSDQRRQDTDGIMGLVLGALTFIIIAIAAISITFFKDKL